jgi:hypothetical protein
MASALLKGDSATPPPLMLIQKIFHVRLNLLETKACLAKLHRDRRTLQDVEVAMLGDDCTAQLKLKPRNGFHAEVELLTLPSEDPCQTLFRSTRGDMEVAGMLEFVPIRDNITEVQLTIDYKLNSPLHRLFDSITACFDHFLNAQLRRIEAHFATDRAGSPFLAESQLAP